MTAYEAAMVMIACILLALAIFCVVLACRYDAARKVSCANTKIQ